MSKQISMPAVQSRGAELTRKVAELREELEELPAERREAFQASLEADGEEAESGEKRE